MSAKWLIDESGKKAGDILEVRGLPGNSVDRDRHIGFQSLWGCPRGECRACGGSGI
jgi:ribose transport system substrate-binding protein